MRAEKWDYVDQIQGKIEKLKKEVKALTPSGVFITFEREEGLETALKFKEFTKENEEFSHLDKWMETEKLPRIRRAPEPDDIIWENFHITRNQRYCKKLVVSFTIVLLLLFSFWLVMDLSVTSEEFIRTYPPTDCEDFVTENSNMLDHGAYGEYLRYQ